MVWLIAGGIAIVLAIISGLVVNWAHEDTGYVKATLGLAFCLYIIWGLLSVMAGNTYYDYRVDKRVNYDTYFTVVDESSYEMTTAGTTNYYVYFNSDKSMYQFFYIGEKGNIIAQSTKANAKISIHYVEHEPARVFVTRYQQSNWYWKHLIDYRFVTYDIYLPTYDSLIVLD